MKIALGIPTYGTIKYKTALSLMELIRLNRQYEFLPIFRYGSIISENRERIIVIAKQQKCDYVFFVDSDISFEPSIINELLVHDKEIVSGMYHYRFLPKTPVNKFFNGQRETVNSIPEIPKELFSVPATGGGCLLVRASVFDEIQSPYFPMEYDEAGNVKVTEDIGFCEKVRAAGYSIWIDPNLHVRHTGDYDF